MRWLRIASTHAGQDNEAADPEIRTQSVIDPEPMEGRPLTVRIHESMGRVVVDLFGHHRMNNGDVIDHLCRMGENRSPSDRNARACGLGLMTRTRKAWPCNWAMGCPLVKDSGMGFMSIWSSLGL